MTKSDLVELVKKYFRATTYTAGELDIVFSEIDRLGIKKLELDSIFKNHISVSKLKLDVASLKLKMRGTTPLKQSNFVPSFEFKCSLCFDGGWNYVSSRHDPRTEVYVRCECDAGYHQGSMWIPQWSKEYIQDLRMKPMADSINEWSPRTSGLTMPQLVERRNQIIKNSDEFWRRYFEQHRKKDGA